MAVIGRLTLYGLNWGTGKPVEEKLVDTGATLVDDLNVDERDPDFDIYEIDISLNVHITSAVRMNMKNTKLFEFEGDKYKVQRFSRNDNFTATLTGQAQC